MKIARLIIFSIILYVFFTIFPVQNKKLDALNDYRVSDTVIFNGEPYNTFWLNGEKHVVSNLDDLVSANTKELYYKDKQRKTLYKYSFSDASITKEVELNYYIFKSTYDNHLIVYDGKKDYLLNYDYTINKEITESMRYYKNGLTIDYNNSDYKKITYYKVDDKLEELDISIIFSEENVGDILKSTIKQGKLRIDEIIRRNDKIYFSVMYMSGRIKGFPYAKVYLVFEKTNEGCRYIDCYRYNEYADSVDFIIINKEDVS